MDDGLFTLLCRCPGICTWSKQVAVLQGHPMPGVSQTSGKAAVFLAKEGHGEEGGERIQGGGRLPKLQ